MGNCLRYIDPSFAGLSRDVGVDITPVKESRLPIIFLIGGPGAGKRTQGIRIARHYGFLGIVTRDLLRDEVATGTQQAVTLARFMSESRLVPSDVMVELIKARMLSGLDTARGFILSGFPRGKEQSKYFDRHVRPPDLVLYLCMRNSVMTDRILARIVTATERQERNFDEIKKRIKTFSKLNKPILRRYSKKLCVIDGEKEESVVFEDICRAIDNVLMSGPSTSPAKETK
ncbi:adenylate kinase isoenzyme 1 [Harpegnathos saltator]|uniref:Adenylate kinase isoenzyme 1 n=1 Tax=Harpegnathos saltator TaxID=610380 RepID=E2BVY8_HARSA|nr:adenylate kinase isoenzyme 1 [Harpegnathos saltator]EFN80136.1 Adenylate kinase isoenzyme 1 [Harpegnathos saltator]